MHALRHNKSHVVFKRQPLLTKLAAYYALSKNHYLWGRVIALLRDLRKNATLLHRILLYFTSKLSANLRFVFNQVSSETKWLFSRTERPLCRDKLFYIFMGPAAPPVRGEKPRPTINVHEAVHKSALRICTLTLGNS